MRKQTQSSGAPFGRAFRELPRFMLLFVLILSCIIFGILNPKFLSIENILLLLRTASIAGLISLGQMLAFSCGEMDFAVGSEASIAGVILGLIVANPAFADFYFPIVLLVLAIGCVLGAINGFLVVYARMPAFVATLGTSTLMLGFGKQLTLGASFYSDYWPPVFTLLGQGSLGGVPVAVLLYFALIVVMFLVTERTKAGRYIYAVGANPEACRNVGISTKRMKFIAFIACAFLCSLAGIVQASQLNVTSPYSTNTVLLNAISATMLGATFYKPGIFNVPGSVVAAVLMTVMANGMTMAGANMFARDAVLGVILLISVGIIAKVRKGGLPAVTFAK